MFPDVEGNIGKRLHAPKSQRDILQVENRFTDSLFASALTHYAAFFVLPGYTAAARIFRSAEIVPERPSSNFTSVSMNCLSLPWNKASTRTAYFWAMKARRTLRVRVSSSSSG